MDGASSGPPHSEIEALREKLYLHLEFALQAGAALREGAAPPGAVPNGSLVTPTPVASAGAVMSLLEVSARPQCARRARIRRR